MGTAVYYPFSFDARRGEEPPPPHRWRDMTRTIGGDRGDLRDVDVDWWEAPDDEGGWVVHVYGALYTTLDLDDEEVRGLAFEIWDGVHRSLYPGVPLVFMHPEDEPASQSIAEDLAALNAHRRQIGMAPLDPAAAGWTDEDVRIEAQRLRGNPDPRAACLGW